MRRSQKEAARLLRITPERMGNIKKGVDISLKEALKLESLTCYSASDINELGGWFCIKNGLSVKDGRAK